MSIHTGANVVYIMEMSDQLDMRFPHFVYVYLRIFDQVILKLACLAT